MEAPAVLEKIRYFIRRALRNMRQWPVLCTAAILTMAIALATMATFFLVVLNIQGLANNWSEEVQVVAYFQAPPAGNKLSTLIRHVEGFPDVDLVTYISSEDAFKRFKSRLGEDVDLLDGVKADLLPASLEVSLKSDSQNRDGVARVVAELKKDTHFSDLRFGQEWLERFENFVDLLKFVGFILGSFFLLAALFIVSNTIKLTLYARRDELEIMALVGATKRFIQIPFLLEGALQGFASGLLSLGFLIITFRFILQESLQSFWLTPTGFDPIFLSGSQQLILVICGIVLGLLGSLVSLRKFVRL